MSLTEDGRILDDKTVIGDIKNGVYSAGVFFQEGTSFVKTDAMAAVDTLLYSMSDYYELKKTQGISSSVYGRLLYDIRRNQQSMAGEDDDEYFSFTCFSGFTIVYPGVHSLLPCVVLHNHGICDSEPGCGFRFNVKHKESRVKISSRNVEILLDSRMRLLFMPLYEILCTGHYMSTRAHRRLEATLNGISSDSSQSLLFHDDRATRFVDLSSAFRFYGLQNIAAACGSGAVDFTSASSSKAGFKLSSLALSALAAMSSRVLVERKEVSAFGVKYELADDVSGMVKNLKDAELSFLHDLVLLSGASKSVDLKTMSVSSFPTSILAMGEICHE